MLQVHTVGPEGPEVVDLLLREPAHREGHLGLELRPGLAEEAPDEHVKEHLGDLVSSWGEMFLLRLRSECFDHQTS